MTYFPIYVRRNMDRMSLDKPLSRRTLRAMRNRWQRDLDRLETAYPINDWEACDGPVETQRNLGTAIAWIDAIITAQNNA